MLRGFFRSRQTRTSAVFTTLAVSFFLGQAGAFSATYDALNPAFDAGMQSFQAKNYSDAVTHFDEAIGTDANLSKAYYWRARTFFELGQNNLALEDLNTALTQEPQNAVYYLWRGKTFIKMGQKDLAIRDFERAVNINPKLAEAFNAIGDFHKSQGNNDQAMAAYNHSIDVGDNDQDALVRRGVLNATLGKSDNAIKDFGDAIALAPQSGIAYFNRGGPVYVNDLDFPFRKGGG